MTIKYLSGAYPEGYALSGAYTGLVIEATASIGGSGVSAYFKASVTNDGTIQASGQFGIYLTAGGTVTNGSTKDKTALIEATHGVWAQYGAATVANFGSIEGDVFLRFGGAVANGGAKDTQALIDGVYARGAPARVTNLGTIADGVWLLDGGNVVNGSGRNTVALIAGVTDDFGSVTNFGTIQGEVSGVILGDGGLVTNGSAADTSALITAAGANPQADAGVYAGENIASIVNFGTILAAGADGVDLAVGGTIINGSDADAKALISGAVGIVAASAEQIASITNFGTVQGLGGQGISGSEALIVNGSATDLEATITGIDMGVVYVTNFASISGVTNTGTIQGADKAGVVDVGYVSNGSTTNTSALISGPIGVYSVGGACSVANFGSIMGAKFAGVFIQRGQVTNGSAADRTALIEGGYGVFTVGGGAATVDNFGTIAGNRGVAVSLGSAADQLDVESGCAFDGVVTGGGATLDLASGSGTFALLPGGDVVVSGSMPTTTFQSFGTLEVGAGAVFSDTGAVNLPKGQGLLDAGTLTLGGAGPDTVVNQGVIEVTGAGTLVVAGAVTGAGEAEIAGGQLTFASSFVQDVDFLNKTGTLRLAQSQSYTGTVTGFFSKAGTYLDLEDIAFVNSGEATYSGTNSGGVLTVTDGVHTARINLQGDYLADQFIVQNDGQGGTTVYAFHGREAPQPHAFIAAMAQLGAPASLSNSLVVSPAHATALLSRPHLAQV